VEKAGVTAPEPAPVPARASASRRGPARVKAGSAPTGQLSKKRAHQEGREAGDEPPPSKRRRVGSARSPPREQQATAGASFGPANRADEPVAAKKEEVAQEGDKSPAGPEHGMLFCFLWLNIDISSPNLSYQAPHFHC
jgi:hypothetical protein